MPAHMQAQPPAGSAATAGAAAARQDQAGVAVDHLQRLWAPWRFGYIAGSEPIDGCPFCVLPARGRDHDDDSMILHRGEHAYVILNAYPYNPGHLMVVPFEHTDDLPGLDKAVAQELFDLGRRAVAMLGEELAAEGVNLGMNLGATGGAGIAEHVHLHVVPRWGGDTNFVTVVGATRVLPRALAEVRDALAAWDWHARA